MSVGIRVGNITDEIGSPDFFHAFFSTISVNLEPQGWGSKFPILMKYLYQGGLEAALASDAVAEIKQVRNALKNLPPHRVVWDFEDRSKQPPWGENISPEITSLADYFVTSTGRDLISTLVEALEDAAKNNIAASIVPY